MTFLCRRRYPATDMGRRTIGLAGIIVRARQLRSEGMTVRAAAAILGVSKDVVIYWTNEADRERQMNNARERGRRNRSRAKPAPPAPPLVLVRPPARLAIPTWDDGRTLTARLCGDPLPSRSALASRGGATTGAGSRCSLLASASHGPTQRMSQ